MAYPTYGGFPVGYSTNAYPQMQVQYPTNNQQSSSNIIWVQGEAGAKAYPVAPGVSVLLMDSESEYFYIKSTDASGMPQPLRKFPYSEEVAGTVVEAPAAAPQFDPDQYVTRSEFEKRLSELSRKPRAEYGKKGEQQDG